MYARFVTIQLKPKVAAQFKETMDTKILPLMQRQPGFQEELVLVATDGRESIGISLWDTQEHAESYARQHYPEVLDILRNVSESTPTVKTYDVPIATFQKIIAKGA